MVTNSQFAFVHTTLNPSLHRERYLHYHGDPKCRTLSRGGKTEGGKREEEHSSITTQGFVSPRPFLDHWTPFSLVCLLFTLGNFGVHCSNFVSHYPTLEC